MLYPLLRPLLFSLEPEKAHKLTFAGLEALHALGFATVLGLVSLKIPRRWQRDYMPR